MKIEQAVQNEPLYPAARPALIEQLQRLRKVLVGEDTRSFRYLFVREGKLLNGEDIRHGAEQKDAVRAFEYLVKLAAVRPFQLRDRRLHGGGIKIPAELEAVVDAVRAAVIFPDYPVLYLLQKQRFFQQLLPFFHPIGHEHERGDERPAGKEI